MVLDITNLSHLIPTEVPLKACHFTDVQAEARLLAPGLTISKWMSQDLSPVKASTSVAVARESERNSRESICIRYKFSFSGLFTEVQPTGQYTDPE